MHVDAQSNVRISAVLEKMAEIFAGAKMPDWASALRRHRSYLSDDPSGARAGVLAMYAGMGSLNDIVIFVDGVLAEDINVELEELRTRLFDLCAT